MSVTSVDIGRYTVKFDGNPIYKEGSADNPHSYDAIYCDDNDAFSTQHDIAIFLSGELLKRVLIGSSWGSTTIHKTSYVFEPDRVVICCSDTVFCLSIPDLSLLWKTKADDATCFEIFKYKSDYIIHGELQISRLSHNGELVWQQSGADIFTTIDSNGDFLITDNYILATDWEKRIYKFDFDGNHFI
jgi:outer membrane protein assembly factor BamB